MLNKTCNVCNVEKTIDNFHPRGKSFRPHCRSCYTNLRRANRWPVEKHREHCRNYNFKRRHEDPAFKVAANLRSRMCAALRGNYKSGSAVSDLGCTVEFFKTYIESLFQKGMTWENYGRSGWHLDHKIPLSKIDLMNREEYLKAVHYTNIQPLWFYQNIAKKNKI